MRTRLVMAVGLAAIVAILVVVLLQQAQRRSGTDLTPNGAFIAAIGASQQSCQNGELLPGDTSALRVTITAYGKPTPPLRISMAGPSGRRLTTGALPGGWREGVVQIPLVHVDRATAGATICLRNVGPDTIGVAGALPDPAYHMTVGPSTIEGRLRYDYMRPGRESWLSLLPTIVHRSTFAKGDLVRHWAWAAVLVLMLAAIGLATRTVLAEDRS